MARPPAYHVDGIKDLQRELKSVGSQWPKELRKAHKEVADVVEPVARGAAVGFGGVIAKAAPSIKAAAEQRVAKLTVTATGAHPFALGAFLGARRYKQFPAWVGNDWEPGGPGGPYGINAAVRDSEERVLTVFETLLDRLTRDAFPNR